MPERETIERARRDRREGKRPTTQAGEFIREEIHHIREGKHGARSTKQAIAIGLSKARRAEGHRDQGTGGPSSGRSQGRGHKEGGVMNTLMTTLLLILLAAGVLAGCIVAPAYPDYSYSYGYDRSPYAYPYAPRGYGYRHGY